MCARLVETIEPGLCYFVFMAQTERFNCPRFSITYITRKQRVSISWLINSDISQPERKTQPSHVLSYALQPRLLKSMRP